MYPQERRTYQGRLAAHDNPVTSKAPHSLVSGCCCFLHGCNGTPRAGAGEQKYQKKGETVNWDILNMHVILCIRPTFPSNIPRCRWGGETEEKTKIEENVASMFQYHNLYTSLPRRKHLQQCDYTTEYLKTYRYFDVKVFDVNGAPNVLNFGTFHFIW